MKKNKVIKATETDETMLGPDRETVESSDSSQVKEKGNAGKDFNTDMLTDQEQEKLLAQCKAEIEEGMKAIQTKREKFKDHLKLYLNHKRKPKTIGVRLAFVVFQTLLANLYEDKLTVKFVGQDKYGDIKEAENVNALAKHDHVEMFMDINEYRVIWDTLCFGMGFILQEEFDYDTKTPVTEVIDPTTVYVDPLADSINGYQKGRGGSRYFGREVYITRRELELNKDQFMNLSEFYNDSNTTPLKDDLQQMRQEAQDLEPTTTQAPSPIMGDNALYKAISHKTWFNGKRVNVILNEKLETVIYYKVTKNQRDWGINTRAIFPRAHGIWGDSVFDVLEDEQRGMSRILNLLYDAIEGPLRPMVMYDKNKVRNRKDMVYESRKAIPVNGPVSGVAQAFPVNSPDIGGALKLFDTIGFNAQKDVAVSEVGQGVPTKQDKTLGELQMVEQSGNKRHSLAAKVFGWSVKDFYLRWLFMYQTYFDNGMGEKVITVTGAYGDKVRSINSNNIYNGYSNINLTVESISQTERERVAKLANIANFGNVLLSQPEADRTFYTRYYGQQCGLDQDLLYRFLPRNSEEIRIDVENEILLEGKLPAISPNDNDYLHISGHRKLNSSKVRDAHIKGHYENIRLKKERPDLYPQLQQQQQQDVQEAGMAGQGVETTSQNYRGSMQSTAGVKQAGVDKAMNNG